MELLIKNARIVDYSHDFTGDIYIKDGKIHEIGLDINKDCTNIDAKGLVLLPSFVDLHAHFREPGYEYKENIETGSKAAARGGYTAVNLMANTNPVCSSMDIVNYVTDKAKKVGLVDVHQAVSITRDFDGHDTSHLDSLTSKVKIISEDGKDVMDNSVMYKAMVKAKEKGIVVMCHSEDKSLSKIDSSLSEDIMTLRNVMLSGITGCRTHIAHVSTKKSMRYIVQAKKMGFNVTCEVTPHHIALSQPCNYSVNPPIREKEDVNYLIECIKEGKVDAISTDHAPHTFDDKKNNAPGISGLETSFAVCYTKLVKTGVITLKKLSCLMSKNPADILKLEKGRIEIGYDADLVLVDTSQEFKVDASSFKSKGKNTPFDGKELYGNVKATIKSGNIVYGLKNLKE